MSDQSKRTADLPARNQRRGETPAPAAENAPDAAQDTPDTPPVPEAGAFRSGAPDGEVAPT